MDWIIIVSALVWVICLPLWVYSNWKVRALDKRLIHSQEEYIESLERENNALHKKM